MFECFVYYILPGRDTFCFFYLNFITLESRIQLALNLRTCLLIPAYCKCKCRQNICLRKKAKNLSPYQIGIESHGLLG